MATSAEDSKLQQIPIDKIDRNPDNPRLVFRPGELEDLQESIRLYGVQVPISVYREHGRFVLIDGERRWRCASKLNNKTLPALVQKKPQALQNLLLMFNIHALREQWDLLTVALKLPKIVTLLTAELGKAPTEKEISEKTGLNRGLIRRCKLLMNLPQQYKDQILSELERPKSSQKFTEDLFIEMERSLTTVERAMPSVIPDRDVVRKVLLKKFRAGVISNRVLFREVAKIARVKKVGGNVSGAEAALRKLFQDNDYKIEQAFEDTVGELYAERDIGTRISSLLGLLDDIESDEIEDNLRLQLEELVSRVEAILQSEQ
jgi:ParB family transcriptional regulator, chromosome partitioning protein